MTKIFITGSCGFIGQNLIKKLSSNKKYEILGLYHVQKPILFKENILYIKGNLSNRKNITNIILDYKPDIVIHLGAKHFIPWCEKNKLQTFLVNVYGSYNIIQACNRASVKKVIFSSSAGIYASSKLKLNEKNAIKPIDIYTKTKILAEKIILNTSKIKSIYICRLSNVYGNNTKINHLIHKVRIACINNQTLSIGNLSSIRDYIHISDLIEAFSLLIKKKEGTPTIKTYNISSGKSYSVKKIISIAKKYFPKFKFNQKSSLQRKNDKKFVYINSKKIQKELNWQPKIKIEQYFKNNFFI